MPNLIVSSNVDTMLGAADNAAIRDVIGLGTASTPTFANLTLTSPSLGSSAPVTISQTWDAGSNVMTALKVVATDTASGTTSSLLSLDLSTDNVLGPGNKWVFDFKKSGLLKTMGNIELGIGQALAASLNMGNGYYAFGGYNGIRLLSVVPGYIFMHGATQMWRGSADHILEQRNGANAQTFNVYGTYSSITDYKRLSLSCSATTGNATIAAPFNSVLAVTGGSSPSTTATITFATQAEAFPVGSSVVVAGVTPSGYNGTYVVTASTTSSISYTVGGALAAWSSGGTATVSGSAAMTLTSAGNVGIGTTSPTSKLHVVGDAVLTGQLLGGDYTVGTVATATQNNVAITNNHTGQTNSSFVITPKGTGSLIAGPKPDGAATGGNARGVCAVDLQIQRNSADRIAQGPNSVIGGGHNNKSEGNSSTVAGGNSNTITNDGCAIGGGYQNVITGAYSCIPGGFGNNASQSNTFVIGGFGVANRFYASVHGGFRFASAGDCQLVRMILSGITTTTNSSIELFGERSSMRFIMPSGKVVSMIINVVGSKSDGTVVATYTRKYALKNVAATTSEIHTPQTIGTDVAAGTSITITADDSVDSLKITVTGVLNETWRWIASIDAVEMAYGI